MAIIRQPAYPLVGRIQRAVSGEGVKSEFVAASYTALGGTWNIVENGQNVRVLRVGQMTLVNFAIRQSSVVGAPVLLKIALPLGLIAATEGSNPFSYLENGVSGIGVVAIQNQATEITLAKDLNLTAWAASAGLTYVFGQLLFEARPVTGQ